MYTTLILFFIFAITMSFLCSLWEAVLLSISPTYTQIRKQDSSFIGRKLASFKSQVDVPLSAILTLNTIAHTVGAIGVGSQAAAIWGKTNPVVTQIIVPVAMTLAILILSEIIPKTIGAIYWRRFTSFTVYSLTVLIKILYPLVRLCLLATKIIPGAKSKGFLTRSEFLILTEIGELHGVFKESEADLIENSLDLHELTVRDVMRPASEMVTLQRNQPVESLFGFLKNHQFTRYPVLDTQKNELVGIVHVKSILSEQDISHIDQITRPILKVDSNLAVEKLLDEFRKGFSHFALVYKKDKLIGFVTLDNVLYVLLGIIKDEFHPTHVDWTQKPDGSIIAKGRCALFAIEQILDIDIEAGADINTLSGLIYDKLERMPQRGDRIEFDTFTAIIQQMGPKEIITVRIEPKAA